jgi:hypothetical protein
MTTYTVNVEIDIDAENKDHAERLVLKALRNLDDTDVIECRVTGVDSDDDIGDPRAYARR